MARAILRVAAVADIHCDQANLESVRDLFAAVQGAADVLLLCGDLTDRGLIEEAQLLKEELHAMVRIPTVGVLGNHDFESNNQEAIRQLLSEAGVCMLDGTSCVIQGVGFAGVKGFCGGFDRLQLQAWGEGVLKSFVHEAIEEQLKLEKALAQLEARPRIAVLHYSPIRLTVEGEPVEIFPFLGSSRLEEPIDRYGVSAVFHGHAHHGRPEGRTAGNVPVYNVAVPVLRRARPGQPPFLLTEIPLEPAMKGQDATL